MMDRCGREIHDLRLSVTDCCNFRCRYCMPTEGCCPIAAAKLLTVEECLEIGAAAVRCGVRKIRLTGGEPLVRPELLEICRGLRKLSGLEELCITTNGSLLRELAKPLREAGVDRLNISLDTLDRERFCRMTRGGRLADVLEGVAAAEAAGFQTLKFDTVLIGGFNEDEVDALLGLSRQHPWEMRLIELMPMGPCSNWEEGRFVSVETVLERYPQLQSLPTEGVARRYRFPGAPGTVGLISPMSHTFCGQCSRIRITADGRLKGCLHSREELDLKGLRGRALEDAIRAGILQKPLHHHLTERPSDTPRCMNQIGG